MLAGGDERGDAQNCMRRSLGALPSSARIMAGCWKNEGADEQCSENGADYRTDDNSSTRS